MPELPEVELLVRGLRPHLVGRRIRSVRLRRARLVASPAPAAFRSRLTGRTVTALERRGKTIVARLDDGGHWLTHLRMTGWFLSQPARDRHTLARFGLDRGEIRYRDPRRFGRMWWVADPAAHFARLGPEPLEPSFALPSFADALARRRIPVKQALLDPALVAGVGNIYASEACHRAGIDPRRPAAGLPREAVAALRRALRRVLRDAIAFGARPGTPRPREFAVYARDGAPCRACGSPVLRTVLGQRSTFFCAVCQR